MSRNMQNIIYLPSSYYKSNPQFHSTASNVPLSPNFVTGSVPSSYSDPGVGELHAFYNGHNNYDHSIGSMHSMSIQVPHLNNCITPTDMMSMDMDHSNRLDKPLNTDAAAEILDLDSNTVHVVNNNSGEQANRVPFYRPFLNSNGNGSSSAASTPPAPAITMNPIITTNSNNNYSNNTWGGPVMEQTVGPLREPMSSHIYSQAQPQMHLHSSMSVSAQPVMTSVPKPTQQPPHPHPAMVFSPELKPEYSQDNGPRQNLNGSSSMGQHSSDDSDEKDMDRTPAYSGTDEVSTPTTGTGNSKPASNKGKGWKGGECKRPKTYNCTACNKWFTSSGHLKRHYGTTLHKNSIRQLGEDGAREPPARPTPQKGPGKGKRKKGGQGQDANGVSKPDPEQKQADNGGAAPMRPMATNNSSEPGRNVESFKPSGVINGVNGGDTSHSHSSVASNSMGARSVDSSAEYNDHKMHLHSPHPQTGDDKFQGAKIGENSTPLNQLNHNNHTQPPQYENMTSVSYQYPYAATNPLNVGVGNSFSPAIGHAVVAPGPALDSGIYSVNVNMGGYNGLNGLNGLNGGLPPFSAVGYSHYDPHMFPPLNSGHHYQNLNASRPVFFTNSPVVVPSSMPNVTEGSQVQNNGGENSHIGSTNPGSPEVGRAASLDYGNITIDSDIGSASNSPSRELSLSSGGDSFTDESQPEQLDPLDQGENQVYRCAECPKTFGRACYLTQHINGSHSGLLPHKCTICGKRFAEEFTLADHFRKHGNDKPYRCEHDQCSKQFNHKTDLRRHLCLHTGEKPFLCKLCGKGFIRKDHMNKHSETHRKKVQQQQHSASI